MSPAHPMHYFINVTTGEAMSISAFAGKDGFLQIKASEFVNLEREYQCYQRAWTDFPGFVPRPLGYAIREQWHIMVSTGVRHSSFPASLLRNFGRQEPQPVSDLLRFFEATHRYELPPGNSPHGALVSDLASFFEPTRYAALAMRWVAYSQLHGLELMPQSPQHGDFVLNNLASSGGRLVVFDWEDYGNVNLGGLDLATLCISVWGEDPTMVRTLMDVRVKLNAPMDLFVRKACGLAGIEFDVFRRQIPLYVLTFLYLKRNYGEAVQLRFGQLLEQLSV